ncbi:hypothetical protein EGI22_02965 [Lacihabitans sp. LS3-19]|uniref:hypothetical protein n=1 Tax=Lacihabitans sp. LS3-19 TaxID=2487335 RepID=UPI0020CF1BC1|nr:hypothetical protein [Lacihabitans sp. LS3-19]MCP9766853.1 hypothetical protein [Lacihabitans sp. LS3-19]
MRKIIVVLILINQVVFGQTLEIVKNINNFQYPNLLNSSAKINGFLYFASNTSDKFSLWKTDGTNSGTIQVLTEFSNVKFLNILISTPTKFFIEVNNDGVNQLWITDGTATGTTNILNVPSLLYNPKVLIGNELYFTFVPVGGTTSELWKTDGTIAGTTLISNFGMPSFFGIGEITNLNGSALFSVRESGGSSLWLSNGTFNGTTKIIDINTNSNIYPNKFGVLGTKAYYVNYDITNGYELWVTDGTASGTHLFVDLNLGSGNSSPIGNTFTTCNGLLFFVANNGTAYKLYKTDGTEAGTVALSDAVNSQFSTFDNLCFCANTTLYFRSSTFSTGIELSKTDGTIAGTSFIKDINVGTGNSNPMDFQYINGKTFFMAITAANGREMYTTDGSTVNTNIIADLLPGSSDGISFKGAGNWDINNKLVFTGYYGPTSSFKPFISDGTAAGTGLLKDILTINYSSNPFDLTKIGNRIYFSASSNYGAFYPYNKNPYFTDGSIPGTQILKDFAVNYSFNNDFEFRNIDNTNFYFTNGGKFLCKSDGTSSGTTTVEPTALGFGGFGVLNNNAFYGKTDGANGNELWKNENGVGTFLKDIYSGVGGSFPINFFNHNNELFFFANSNLYGKELWKTDGTITGTVLLKDMNPGTDWSYIDDVKTISHNGSFYTFLTTSNDGKTLSLIKSDGTTANTNAIYDFNKLTGSTFGYFIDRNSKLFVFNNQVYFTIINCNNYQAHIELWKTDGTNIGTTFVKVVSPDVTVTSVNSSLEINDLTYNLYPFSIFVKGNKFYFYTHSYLYVSNSEEYFTNKLWISDGTVLGTSELSSFTVDYENYNSFFNGNKNYIFNISENEIGFVFYDLIHGQEIWKTDGTIANTQFFYDINPGPKGSFADSFTELNGYSYFDADNGTIGNELLRFNQALQIFETIATGNWNANATWNSNTPPTSTNTTKINNTHIVTIPNTGNEVKTIQMNGGVINLNGGTLEIKNQ